MENSETAILHPRSSIPAFLPPAILAVVTILLLLPFIDKPIHMDDPVWIWTAQHITAHPRDFYGFEINWGFTSSPLWRDMKNPPGFCYFLAAVGSLFGWTERALHAAMLLPTVLAVLGTYFLARQFRATVAQSILAACATLASPVFFVSATSVMCDVTQLALFIWAIWFWVRGMGRNSLLLLLASGVLITAAIFTKYFGLALLPLVIAYSIAHTRKPWGRWLLALLIPVVALIGYHIWTQRLYGVSLLNDAIGFAGFQRWGDAAKGSALGDALVGSRTGRTIPTLICGLTFAGGGCATIFLLAAVRASRRAWIIGLVALLAITALLFAIDTFPKNPIRTPAGLDWPLLVQLSLWTFVGCCLLTMAALYVVRLRTPEALLLALWVMGTFTFATLVSWTVAARFVLPLTPAAAIIAATFPARRPGTIASPTTFRLALDWTAVATGFALAFIVALADQSVARTARDATVQTIALYRAEVGQPRDVHFSGHWGFQYYMQQLGAKIIDTGKFAVTRGDGLIIPENNINVLAFPEQITFRLATLQFQPLSFCTTTRGNAFFYSNVRGPLPFAFGQTPPELYHVEVLKESMISR